MHESDRIGKFLPLMKSLYNSARSELGFEPHAKICIIKSDKNMNNPLGKTAHYSPSEHKIALYTQGRHIKDILRSLAHELVHHNQNCRGDFDIGGETVQGYAQEDGHLREMEREAYECGNMIFRDWEDNLKKKGARPLFTSTTPYVQPMTTNVVGGRLLEENKMKNKVNESQLRDIIRGVIQEMFNDDLNEDDISAEETARAKEESSEVWKVTPENKENKKVKTLKLNERQRHTKTKDTPLEEPKGKRATKPFRYETGDVGGPVFEDSEAKETEDYGEDEGADRKKEEKMHEHVRALEGHMEALKRDMGYDEGHEYRREKGTHFDESQTNLSEDSEKEETEHEEENVEHDWNEEMSLEDRISAMMERLEALREDMAYDEEHEELEEKVRKDIVDRRKGNDPQDRLKPLEEEVETFMPRGRSIRDKARLELNEALMKRWIKNIK